MRLWLINALHPLLLRRGRGDRAARLRAGDVEGGRGFAALEGDEGHIARRAAQVARPFLPGVEREHSDGVTLALARAGDAGGREIVDGEPGRGELDGLARPGVVLQPQEAADARTGDARTASGLGGRTNGTHEGMNRRDR